MSQSGVFTAPSGVTYHDRKRYFWSASLIVPLTGLAAPLAYLAGAPAWVLWVALLFYYGGIPLFDYILGEDRSNPPEEVVPQLEADPFYRRITYALIPVIWGMYLFAAWFVATQPLPFHAVAAMVLLAGGTCGFAINLGHELGHKTGFLERWLARFALAPCAYGHFNIEHNKGHHVDVATPQDPASARMGESIWQFVLREVPGGARRAWRLEKNRLARQGHSVWSIHNEILQPAAITVLLWGSLCAIFGIGLLPWLVAVAAWGGFQLTSANYVEHYGLLRQKDAHGRYERTQPHHSWNSNHIMSNWATFHLQRHSDHHAYPARRYQSLRHFEDLPRLPSGYFGMFLIAYVSPLWYAVMDKRLVEQVGHDSARINFDPKRRDRLMLKYQMG